MNDSLRGKIVVVTGGTAGIGYAAALAFVARGARVVVLSRERARVDAAAAALGSDGFAVDVSDWRAVDDVAERIERSIGPIDVWVNNAMTTVFGRCVDTPPEDVARVTSNTYLGAVHGTLAALRHMRPRDRGVIVQVGSALAFLSVPLQAPYCAAKHAIRGYTNALRAELLAEQSRVRLTSVHLSAFDTPQFDWARSYLDRRPRPLAPVFVPAIAGDAIVMAATGGRREYWVGWPAVKTIWASRLAPALAERIAARTAIGGQHDEARAEPRPGNLFEPVERPPGAAGRFGDEARGRSLQWSLSKRRKTVIGIAAVLAAGGAILLFAG
jgi:NAD(P)-dependent dehydrogenase (short-subunit alcohol dehydrogenase family)